MKEKPIKYQYKSAVTLITTIFINGCAGDLTPINSNLIGKCEQLVTEQYVYKTSCWSGSEKFMVSSEENKDDECLKGGVIGVLPKGQLFQVTNVFRMSWGESGDCLRVMVRPVDGPLNGMSMDIPACIYGGRPRPIWLAKSGDDGSESLVIIAKFAVNAECPK